MRIKEWSIEFNDEAFHYEVHVEDIFYFKQKPMGKWADSDVDCHGYEDFDFKIVKIFIDGLPVDEKQLDVEIDKSFKQISDVLFNQIKEMSDDRN